LVNLGSGPPGASRLPACFAGWREVRVDIDPAAKPDIVADITNLPTIPTGSVDCVWTTHCIEHLYPHDVVRAIAEIRRILAPQGVACIVVPDLQAIATHLAEDRMHETLYESAAGPITPYDLVFGLGRRIALGHVQMAHHSGFTPSLLGQALTAGGFDEFVLRRRANFELAAVAHRTSWSGPQDVERLLTQLEL
jgi:SAM-dependent methyltransferase